ncbi:glycosyltransferase family protein [Microcoleus sp. PH2017_28_MFU_U_A]|uniref:glycosyltransferase family protein n=1 Tax=Microcoleus sp. PH2017_28_MFU_U_A TaxID=2798838 RepID=UPI002D800322|nr:glycosyltransferase [Microcoleus sp. PH2017_28_MFU_U_A]
MRLMVYSHDAFGLGNIRRMLTICEHLLSSIPELSILVVSGSPMLQSFRLPPRLDYIKIPCLNRGESGEISVKYLKTDISETIKMRSDLILMAAINFKPDAILVDKKPYGIKNELVTTLKFLKKQLPQTKLLLLLRDILDAPEKTISEWQEHGFYQAVEKFYDQILVVGMPEVFDICREYQFPPAVAQKVRYCGYIRKEPGLKSREARRQELQVQEYEQLVLVTPGGGEDGYHVVDTYLTGVAQQTTKKIRSVIICGSEMPAEHREQLYQKAALNPQVEMLDFTDDLMSYIDAADVVVCMSGYNTITEVLSLGKRTIAIPRIKPASEQLMRAEKMSKLGLLKMIHPCEVTPENLMDLLLTKLEKTLYCAVAPGLDLGGLPRISHYISHLLSNPVTSIEFDFSALKPKPIVTVQ